MQTSNNSSCTVEDFLALFDDAKKEENTPHISARSAFLPEEFSLKSVVSAVVDYLNSMFTKLVNIEIKNLCTKDVSINGNKKQLHDVLGVTIGMVLKSFQNRKGVISVIIHDLKRSSDNALLPKETVCNDSSTEKESRDKYVAISVRKVDVVHFEKKDDTDSRNYEGSEVSYYDGGVIVRTKSAHAIIYLTRAQM